MSLKRFDEALKKKLLKVFPNTIMSSLSDALANSRDTEISVQSPVNGSEDSTFEATKDGVFVKVPLIAFDRISNNYNFEYQANDFHSRRGRFVIPPEELEPTTTKRVQVLPLLIVYQIDIISDKREEVDDIFRELSMYLLEHNSLEVEFNGEMVDTEKFTITLVESDTTTDIETFSDRGRVYRQTITVEIREAKLLFERDVHLIRDIPVRFIKLED